MVENRSSKQCENNWRKHKVFSSGSQLEDHALIANNEVKRTKMCQALKRCAEGLGCEAAEAARSGTRYHCSRASKAGDGLTSATLASDP